MTQDSAVMSQPGYAPSQIPAQAPQMAMPQASPPVAYQQPLTTQIPSPSVPQSPAQMVQAWMGQGQVASPTQMLPQQYSQPVQTGPWAPVQVATPMSPWVGQAASIPQRPDLGYQQWGIPAVTEGNKPHGVEQLKREYAEYGPYALEAAAYDSNLRGLRAVESNRQLAALIQSAASPVLQYWQYQGVDPNSINPSNLGQAVSELVTKAVKMEQLLNNLDELSKYFIALDLEYQKQDQAYAEYSQRWSQVRQQVEGLMNSQQPQQQQQQQFQRQAYPAASPQSNQVSSPVANIHPAQRWQAYRELAAQGSLRVGY